MMEPQQGYGKPVRQPTAWASVAVPEPSALDADGASGSVHVEAVSSTTTSRRRRQSLPIMDGRLCEHRSVALLEVLVVVSFPFASVIIVRDCVGLDLVHGVVSTVIAVMCRTT